MTAKLNPYINFRTGTRAAMEFYRSVFGGKLDVLTFKDLNAAQDPSEEDLVMHSYLESDTGIVLMASDTPPRVEYRPGNSIRMALGGEDEKELRGYFDKLAEGGTVTMPLQEATWGDTFGMLVDRYGVEWLVNISKGGMR